MYRICRLSLFKQYIAIAVSIYIFAHFVTHVVHFRPHTRSQSMPSFIYVYYLATEVYISTNIGIPDNVKFSIGPRFRRNLLFVIDFLTG